VYKNKKKSIKWSDELLLLYYSHQSVYYVRY